MKTRMAAQILVYAEEPDSTAPVCRVLREAGNKVDTQRFDLSQIGELPDQDILIVSSPTRMGEEFCRNLRQELKDRYAPILVLVDGGDAAARAGGLKSGADAVLAYPCPAEELLLQVEALARLKRIHDRLYREHEEFLQLNQRLQQAYQQIDRELLLARRLQHSLLPQTLPQVPPARFAVHYRPCGQVGGDFYDVFRLDEDHVGFYVADVMGHGVPASLLTMFLKMAVRAKEISGQDYRLLSPDQVLKQVNEELIAQEMAENPFITMVYALFDRRNLTLSFARAGHPYPLYIPRRGDLRFWQLHGTLLGVFATQFAAQTQELRPGDKVLFYTDGLETSRAEEAASGSERLLELAAQYRELDIEALVERLARALFAEASQPDDFTLLGLGIGHRR
jgi:sigma-B regulation protein RsbU (phosphoserine phosphatase)